MALRARWSAQILFTEWSLSVITTDGMGVSGGSSTTFGVLRSGGWWLPSLTRDSLAFYGPKKAEAVKAAQKYLDGIWLFVHLWSIPVGLKDSCWRFSTVLYYRQMPEGSASSYCFFRGLAVVFRLPVCTVFGIKNMSEGPKIKMGSSLGSFQLTRPLSSSSSASCWCGSSSLSLWSKWSPGSRDSCDWLMRLRLRPIVPKASWDTGESRVAPRLCRWRGASNEVLSEMKS